MELVIVTGLSGAGKSCVINALEDIGYFCIDNLPSDLIPALAKLLKESGVHEKVAIVTDIRTGLTSTELVKVSQVLKELSVKLKILYLDCSDEVLISRYKQTRRIHPLTIGKNDTLSDAIVSERVMLSSVRKMADLVLDTTEMSISECKARVISLFCDNSKKQMHIQCISFGFKHGIPKDADYIFDVRFLPNPYYVPELKELTGLDEQVRNFVMDNFSACEFEKNLHSLILFILPECIKEGRSQLILCIGCTGGHHRSVTITERLHKLLKEKNYNVSITHRDINK